MKRTFVAIFALALAGQALAVNKCTDSTGKVTFQEKACDVDKSQSNVKVWKDGNVPDEPSRNSDGKAGATDLVTLQEASLVILQKSGSSFVVFTLRPKWKNDNTSKVSISYKTQFLDSSRTEIGVDSRFKEVDPNSVSTASQVVGTFEGKTRDKFDYKKVAYAVITYSAGRDKVEKKFTNVTIQKVTE
jgi:hypothetical protein